MPEQNGLPTGCLANSVRALNQDNLEITASPVPSSMLAGLLNRIEDGTISGKIAKDVFRSMWAGEGDVDSIIESKGLRQITDSLEIETLVDQSYATTRSGRAVQVRQEQGIRLFCRAGYEAFQGKANPQQVNSLLKQKLK